jgi:hypothetical protein
MIIKFLKFISIEYFKKKKLIEKKNNGIENILKSFYLAKRRTTVKLFRTLMRRLFRKNAILIFILSIS